MRKQERTNRTISEHKVVDFERKGTKKKKRKKKKSNSTAKFFVGFFGLVAVISLILWLLFPTKKITVEGNHYYTNAQIKHQIYADHYVPNGLFLKMRNKILPISTEEVPFVKNMKIEVKNRTEVVVTVYENLRAGCIEYAGKYVYFDKNGFMLEVMNQKLVDVPLVTGLSYKQVKISEKLPLEDEDKFDEIITITTLITKNKLTIDEIQFLQDGEIHLKKGKIEVNLGEGEKLEAKISQLSGIFQSLKGKEGIVHMENYTEKSPIITFKQEK